ncbi:hypothetical protein [Thalassoroseus pseudoceratinae]|uniref:hypothetical protein n=1 Tax=Thalassoroseus pseudoceratinae TaxID=2713176 RepID=UPI0014214D80|nr:hypothetical protein [Thalassoroseus pseudoceratinae]
MKSRLSFRGVFAKNASTKARRRNHSRMAATAEVLETRRVLSAATVTPDVVPETIINDDAFDEMVSGDFSGDGTRELFFWNRQTGANRFVDPETGNFFTNTIDPRQINGGVFESVTVGNFLTTTPEESEMFFWDPVSGSNRTVVAPDLSVTSRDGAVVFDNLVATNLINGNDFSTIVAGDFRTDAADLDELFFWDPSSGQNRFVTFSGSSSGSASFSTNVINPAAINGNDFTIATAGNFDGAAVDELFFLNNGTGRNRMVLLNDNSLSVFAVETNLVAPNALNGNVYSTVITSDFDGDLDSDIFLWDPQSGQNRLLSATPGQPPTFQVETNCVNRAEIDRVFDEVTLIDGATINADGLFFWDASEGTNTKADFTTAP